MPIDMEGGAPTTPRAQPDKPGERQRRDRESSSQFPKPEGAGRRASQKRAKQRGPDIHTIRLPETRQTGDGTEALWSLLRGA